MSPTSKIYKGINYQHETLHLIEYYEKSIPQDKHRDLHGTHEALHKQANRFLDMSTIQALVAYRQICGFKLRAKHLNGRAKMATAPMRSNRLWESTGGRPQPDRMPTIQFPSFDPPVTPVAVDDPFSDPQRNTAGASTGQSSSGNPIADVIPAQSTTSAASRTRRRTYDGNVQQEDLPF